MDIEAFWALIESSADSADAPGSPAVDSGERTRKLTEALAKLPVDELVEFDLHLERQKRRADTWLMWGAAYAICDSLCSDDGFWYFQAWLVGLGRETFDRVVADPDSLVDVPAIGRLAGRRTEEWGEDEWPDWELLDYVAAEAYEQITEGAGDDFEDLLDTAGSTGLASPDPVGEQWDFEDAAGNAQRLPRVSALFPLSPIEDRDAHGKAIFDDFLAQTGQTESEFLAALENPR